MTPQEMVEYWLITADHSWKTAQDLFAKRDYVDALFHGHLYLEKLLKAAAVQHTQKDAPWGHKLNKIAQTANLALTTEQSTLLERVTEYNTKTRYPDWQFEFRKKCNKQFCQTELDEIRKFGKWIRKQIKP
jgi:HEPN domain-containing protein